MTYQDLHLRGQSTTELYYKVLAMMRDVQQNRAEGKQVKPKEGANGEPKAHREILLVGGTVLRVPRAVH